MNNIKTIENARPIGGDYFGLIYYRKSDKYLKDFLPLFNFQDYWCYKCTRQQKVVNYEDLLEFKYSRYTFFKKNIYSKENIDIWIKWMINIGGIQFLSKPTPPFNPNKIIIRK